jgi:deoxyinosine 3'endonuclease (endonuclease V)
MALIRVQARLRLCLDTKNQVFVVGKHETGADHLRALGIAKHQSVIIEFENLQ